MSIGNPATALLARQIMESLANRGSSPGGGGPPGQPPGAGSPPGAGPQGAAPEMATHALSGRLNELQGADPGAMLRKFQQMKQDAIALIPFAAFALPGVSKPLSKVWSALDECIKQTEQAVNTQKTVKSTPVGMSAANPGQGQSPGPANGSPFMGGSGMGM